MTRIAILDDYQNVALSMADWSQLDENCEIKVFNDHLPFGDPLLERLLPFEVLCVMRERTPFPRALLEHLPQLKLLVTSGGRNAAIDMNAAQELGIVASGTRATGHATAELAFGLIIALARGLPKEINAMKQGGWQVGIGRDLQGATLGVLGLGRLGSKIAGFGRTFGMNIVAWSQNLTDEQAQATDVRKVSKQALFAESDFLTIHVRLSERTRGLVNSETFRWMKPTAFLVNTSRGPIIDEAALIQALREHRIAGAAIDVYDREPLSADHRLRDVPNLICTPHIGYVTEDTYRLFYADMVEAVVAYLDDNPIRLLNE